MTDIPWQIQQWSPVLELVSLVLLVIVTIYYAIHTGKQSKLLYNNTRKDRLVKELELVIFSLERTMQLDIRGDAHNIARENINQYRYLCPEDLRLQIEKYLECLEDKARGGEINPERTKFYSESTGYLFGENGEKKSGVPDGTSIPGVRDGAVPRRRSEISEELKRLELEEAREHKGWIRRCAGWIRRRYFYNKTREYFIEAKTFYQKIRNKI